MRVYSQTNIVITIDGRSLSASLVDNSATRVLIQKLEDGPVTISMDNYGGFEKVGALPWSLPSSDTYINTKPGDIMLYTSNNIVIFYGQNSWDYTSLGKLETTDPNEIRKFVGDGPIKVTLTLENNAGLEIINEDLSTNKDVYSLIGIHVKERPLKPGIYIIDNKKVLVK